MNIEIFFDYSSCACIRASRKFKFKLKNDNSELSLTSFFLCLQISSILLVLEAAYIATKLSRTPVGSIESTRSTSTSISIDFIYSGWIRSVTRVMCVQLLWGLHRKRLFRGKLVIIIMSLSMRHILSIHHRCRWSSSFLRRFSVSFLFLDYS